jgi:hypothetical protein
MSTGQDNKAREDGTTKIVLFVLALAVGLVVSLMLPACLIFGAWFTHG